jgi:hypothetical protein
MELFSYSYKNTLYIIQQPRKIVNRNRKTFDIGRLDKTRDRRDSAKNKAALDL